jgi:hypothetical protein
MGWDFADVENKLGEVITRALTEGPQRIRFGDQSVVMVAEADYRDLTEQHPTFMDYLLAGPDLSDLDLTRIR